MPTAQSERMGAARTGAGKAVVTVVLRGEDHWLSLSDTRTQVLTALGDCLKQHL